MNLYLKIKTLTEGKADITLNTILEASRKLNRSTLRREKYNLINEIKNYYNLDEFFRHQVVGYKAYASFYKLIEILILINYLKQMKLFIIKLQY
jgi:hypothetical protein